MKAAFDNQAQFEMGQAVGRLLRDTFERYEVSRAELAYVLMGAAVGAAQAAGVEQAKLIGHLHNQWRAIENEVRRIVVPPA